jgi:hypothetical protein
MTCTEVAKESVHHRFMLYLACAALASRGWKGRKAGRAESLEGSKGRRGRGLRAQRRARALHEHVRARCAPCASFNRASTRVHSPAHSFPGLRKTAVTALHAPGTASVHQLPYFAKKPARQTGSPFPLSFTNAFHRGGARGKLTLPSISYQNR